MAAPIDPDTLRYASNWIAGYGARRPKLPSEKRSTVVGTKRYLPSARADMGLPRPLLPWTSRVANDWRGIKAA